MTLAAADIHFRPAEAADTKNLVTLAPLAFPVPGWQLA